MLERLKYTLKFFFVSPKPRIQETEYISERKSFRIDYGKYYTKKESFTLLMSSVTLLTFTGECLLMSIFLYGDLIFVHRCFDFFLYGAYEKCFEDKGKI